MAKNTSDKVANDSIFDEFLQSSTADCSTPKRESYDDFLKSMGKFSEQAKVEEYETPYEFEHFKINEHDYNIHDIEKPEEIDFNYEHDVNETRPRGTPRAKKFIENQDPQGMLYIAITELLKPKFDD